MPEAATLDMEDLRETVAEVLDVEEDDLTNDADFISDLEVDSLMALEVMVALERKYGVKLDETELKSITTLRRAYDLLSVKLDGAP